MPIDPNYTPPRAEPLQLQAGQSKSGVQFGFPIAAIAVNNNTEYYAFITPSNRPGFWVQPYQIGLIVNLYPPANYLSITQSIDGPNNTSGVISSGATATLDMQVYDAPLSPQAGIISGPDALYESADATFDVVANFGGSQTILTPNPGENIIITKLAVGNLTVTGSLLLSPVDCFWEELPPPPPPSNPFVWGQGITTKNTYVSESFDPKSAIIHDGSTLQFAAAVPSFGYYTTAGLTITLLVEVQFYRVIA